MTLRTEFGVVEIGVANLRILARIRYNPAMHLREKRTPRLNFDCVAINLRKLAVSLLVLYRGLIVEVLKLCRGLIVCVHATPHPLSRCMRPEGPWHRRWASLITIPRPKATCSVPAGLSDPPGPPNKGKIHSVWPARPPPPGADPKLLFGFHPLPSSPGPPKSGGNLAPALVVGTVISGSHRTAPVLPTPLDGVSPLVLTREMWVGVAW